MKFKTSDLFDLVFEEDNRGMERIQTSLTNVDDHGCSYYNLIFYHQNKYYRFQYRVDKDEGINTRYAPDFTDCKEVFPSTKTIVIYE